MFDGDRRPSGVSQRHGAADNSAFRDAAKINVIRRHEQRGRGTAQDKTGSDHASGQTHSGQRNAKKVFPIRRLHCNTPYAGENRQSSQGDFGIVTQAKHFNKQTSV